ncbi:diacylglycerol/lipid kinase family protein [Alloscardovia theropitheci]|nr:diacylglycerol kinase family protein [Alloscardovia theropitheci]
MRFHFIVNPHGGSGRAITVWREVERIARLKNLDYSAQFPTDEYHVRDIVHDLTNRSENDDDIYLVVVGGDGTLNVAINGIVNFSKTFIGLIPAGSGNDFARANNLPQELETLLERMIDTSRIRNLDLGVVTLNTCFDDLGHPLEMSAKRLYFNNAVGVGFDADVCVRISHIKLKNKLAMLHLSKLAYLGAALPLFFKKRRFDMEMTYQDENGSNRQLFSDVLFAAVMNQPYEGGGFKFSPDAIADDAQLDTCVAAGISSSQLLNLIPRAMMGKHTHCKGITMSQSDSYRIRTNHPVWVHTDGEVEYRTNDISVSLVPGAIQFLGL